MPIIHYLCYECNNAMGKFFRQVKDSPAFFICTQCGKNAKKILKAPSSASTITIDNGVQGRSVEVNLEIIEDNAKRNKD